MALKIMVKVSGITNLSDARYCAGMGVDMLGFNINPHSPQYTDPLGFQEITGWIAGVKLVGEAHGMTEAELREQVVKYPLDYLELTDATLIAPLQSLHLPIILSVSSIPPAPGNMARGAQMLLLQQPQPLNPRQISELTSDEVPLLIEYKPEGLTLEDILAHKAIKGIVLQGSYELKPGVKDYDELAQVLEALEADY